MIIYSIKPLVSSIFDIETTGFQLVEENLNIYYDFYENLNI